MKKRNQEMSRGQESSEDFLLVNPCFFILLMLSYDILIASDIFYFSVNSDSPKLPFKHWLPKSNYYFFLFLSSEQCLSIVLEDKSCVKQDKFWSSWHNEMVSPHICTIHAVLHGWLLVIILKPTNKVSLQGTDWDLKNIW